MPSPSGTPSYLHVLRLPGAARLFAFALWARLSYGTVFLSLTLALTHATGSYATTGACIAMFGLTNAFLASVRAGLIDRHGLRRTLPPMAGAYALILAALTATTLRSGTPAPVLLLLSTAAGACAPPLGPTMRKLWSELAADGDLRRRAFALDTVCEEMLYLIGPLVAGALATWVAPAAGVAASAFLVLSGTLAMVSALPHQDAVVSGRERRNARRFRRPHVRPLRGAVPGSLAVGMSLSALSLLIVAFAQRHHQSSLIAWVEAAMAAGSACGGLVFGALDWRASNRRQLFSLIGVIGAFVAVAGSAGDVGVLIAIACVLGLFVSPAMTMTYVVADEAAEPDQRTKAGGLVNGAYNLGASVGSAAAGLLLAGFALRTCFLLAALPALGTAAGAALWPWPRSTAVLADVEG